MARPPISRFAFATSATALLTFLLVVPTVLHLADPAFGQGVGTNGGYGDNGGYGPRNPSPFWPVWPPSNPGSGPVGPGPGDNPGNGGENPGNGGDNPGNAGQNSNTDGTSSGTDGSGSTDGGQPTDGGANTGGSGTGTPTAPVGPRPPGEQRNEPASILDVIPGQTSFETTFEQVFEGDELGATFNLPSALDLDAPLPTSPDRLDFVTRLLEQPSVSRITVTAGTGAVAVDLKVEQFLPNMAPDAIPTLPGTGVASVVLNVAGANGEKTPFQVLKVLKIEADGLPAGGVAGANVQFRVTEAELDAMGLTPSDIRLLHLSDGKWVELETSLLAGPEDGAYFFGADTPHFSYFAIGAAQPQENHNPTQTSALGTVGLLLAAITASVILARVATQRRR